MASSTQEKMSNAQIETEIETITQSLLKRFNQKSGKGHPLIDSSKLSESDKAEYDALVKSRQLLRGRLHDRSRGPRPIDPAVSRARVAKWNANNPEKRAAARRKYAAAGNNVCVSVRNSAKLGKYDLELDNDAIKDLAFSPCAYCGSAFSAGVDRIDSNLGYTKENSTACCRSCNFMKMAADVDTFIARCKAISDPTGDHDFETLFPRAKRTIGYEYWASTGKNRHQGAGLEVNITKAEYHSLLNGACAYTGVSRCNGIDRIDNDKGYTTDNVESCIKHVNIMKAGYTKEFFLSHVARIANYDAATAQHEPVDRLDPAVQDAFYTTYKARPESNCLSRARRASYQSKKRKREEAASSN